MYFKYGDFQHDLNLVDVESLTKQVIRGRRGRRERVRHTLTIAGELKPDTATQADIRTKIEELEAAYDVDGQDAGLYHNDGSRSPHFLDSGASLTGVQLVSLSYPKGDNPRSGQYVTTRSFRIVLQAEYPANFADALVFWRESITVRGNGGPRFTVTELDSGSPVIEQVSDQTPVFVTQTGQAVGLTGYPEVPAALSGPGLVMQGSANIGSLDGPETNGNGLQNYGVRWQYQFIKIGGVGQFTYLPTIR